MTDIVTELREAQAINPRRMRVQAADEIERLRAEVERLRAGGCARDQKTTQWCAEAVALRAALRSEPDNWNEVDALRAEVTKLREALREVMRCQEGIAHAHAKPGWEKSIAAAWKQALAALEPKEGER